MMLLRSSTPTWYIAASPVSCTVTQVCFYDDLNPVLGYGQTGPYRQAPGYDAVVGGEAGIVHAQAQRHTVSSAS
jgi:hypothetical protein